MPTGPLGAPRPGVNAFQSIEIPAFKQPPEQDMNTLMAVLEDILGEAAVGKQTTPEMSGAVLVMKTKTDKVFVDDIETLMKATEKIESMGSSNWSVTARTEGKGGAMRPLTDAKQKVKIFYSRVPKEAMGAEPIAEEVMMRHLTEKGWPGGATTPALEPDEVDSINIDFSKQTAEVVINKNKIDNNHMSAIETKIGGFPTELENKIIRNELGDPTESDFDAVSDLTDRLYSVGPEQISVEAV